VEDEKVRRKRGGGGVIPLLSGGCSATIKLGVSLLGESRENWRKWKEENFEIAIFFLLFFFFFLLLFLNS